MKKFCLRRSSLFKLLRESFNTKQKFSKNTQYRILFLDYKNMNRILVWILYLLPIAIPLYGFSLININNMGLLPPGFLIGILLILFFFSYITVTKNNLRYNLTSIVTLFLLIVSTAGLINYFTNSFSLGQFISTWLQVVFVILIYFVITNIDFEPREFGNLLRIWVGVGGILAVYGIYQAVALNFGLPLDHIPLNNPSYGSRQKFVAVVGYIRATSVFNEPTYFGSFLISPIILVFSQIKLGSSTKILYKSKFLNRAILVLLLLGLMASMALGPILVLCASFFILLFKDFLRHPGRNLFFLAILLVCLYIIFGFMPGNQMEYFTNRVSRLLDVILLENLSSISATSIGVRFASAIASIKMWLSHPFLGVGLNQYNLYVSSIKPSWYTWEETLAPHSTLTSTLSQMGLAGFLAWAGVWVSLLAELNGYIGRARRCTSKYLAKSLYYLVIASALGSIVSLPFFHIQRWFDISVASLFIMQAIRHQKGELEGDWKSLKGQDKNYESNTF